MRGSILFLLVFMALLSGLVPPVARVHADERLCFPNTGQCIEGRFRTYWEQNGGLSVFGYPITSVHDEINRDTGQTYLTQWFERYRFELHPVDSGPANVFLGRLGHERLRQLNIDWQTLTRESGPRSNCLWFEQTGHNVCDQGRGIGFKSYWQSHGLRDPKLSAYQRSLALFGLPLTEPRMETNTSGNTVLTQWFERARFEWHPNNRTEFRVLLGLRSNELRRAGGPVVWAADHETGSLSQWEAGQGQAVFNTGTGTATPTTAVAHRGRFALALTIQEADGQPQAARIFRLAENLEQAYYSAWFFFPQRYAPAEWWNVFQFKSRTGTRNDPTWVLNVGQHTSGEMYFYLYDWLQRQSYQQSVRTIPVGRWVHVEALYRRSTSRTGRIALWQDGEVLFDVDGVQTALGENVQWSINNYTDRIRPSTATIYVDDAVISTQRVGPGGADDHAR